MRTLRTIFVTLTAIALGGAVAIGCGGDDSNPADATDGGGDGGGSDSPINPQPDADLGDSNQPMDGGDAGRDFAAYVVDLITNKTSETTPPTSDLCTGCTDKQDKTQFNSLFP